MVKKKPKSGPKSSTAEEEAAETDQTEIEPLQNVESDDIATEKTQNENQSTVEDTPPPTAAEPESASAQPDISNVTTQVSVPPTDGDWGGWLASARAKTWSTLELMKHDMTEFTGALQTEADKIASNTVQVVKTQAEQLKRMVDEDPNPVEIGATPNPRIPPTSSQSMDAIAGSSSGWWSMVTGETDGKPDEQTVDKNDAKMSASKSWWDNLKTQAENLLTEEVEEEEQKATGSEGDKTGDKPKLSTNSNSDNKTVDQEGEHSIWSQLNTFVNKVMVVEDTTEGEENNVEALMLSGDTVVSQPITANKHNRLYAIQLDERTYACDPDGAPELFDDWCDTFDISDHQTEISELLSHNPAVRNIYAKLVPAEVGNRLFWQRYFYRLHLHKLDEARKQAFIRRTSGAKLTVLDEGLTWDDADDDVAKKAAADDNNGGTPDTASDGWSMVSDQDNNTTKDRSATSTPTGEKGEWVDWDES